MELHKWTIRYDSNGIDEILQGAAYFQCSCTLTICGPRAEVLRLMYDHLPKDWWPVWNNNT